MDFDKYILTVEKRIVKISLAPDKEELQKAFWAGFKYHEELEKMKKDSKKDDSLNIFKDIFNKK
mgnify:CR=1 FL=1